MRDRDDERAFSGCVLVVCVLGAVLLITGIKLLALLGWVTR